MSIENNPPPAEIPPAPPVQTENPPPAPVPAPPPATSAVVTGTKTEREIELERQFADTTGKLTATERRALEAERKAAEFERDNEELKKIPTAPAKKKVKRYLISPVLGADEEIEEAYHHGQ